MCAGSAGQATVTWANDGSKWSTDVHAGVRASETEGDVPAGRERKLLCWTRLEVPPEGLEQSDFSSGNKQIGSKGGATVGAVDPHSCSTDPNPQLIIDAWPTLPAAIKAGILAMVKRS